MTVASHLQSNVAVDPSMKPNLTHVHIISSPFAYGPNVAAARCLPTFLSATHSRTVADRDTTDVDTAGGGPPKAATGSWNSFVVRFVAAVLMARRERPIGYTAGRDKMFNISVLRRVYNRQRTVTLNFCYILYSKRYHRLFMT